MPVVDNGDRDLCGLVVVNRSDEPRDAHTTTVGAQREDRLVIVMVDIGEVANFCVGKLVLPDEEARCRDSALNRAKPSNSSGPSPTPICRRSTVQPSRRTSGRAGIQARRAG
jgi:hypothetical protein